MTTELLLARRELALEKQAAEMRRNKALAFFTPHAKQEQFFAAANYHYRYARTGNRFGKSEMGAAEDVAFALGFRPWYPVGNPMRTLGIPNHPTKGLIITTDWGKSEEVFTATTKEENDGMVMDVVQGKLFKYIPKAALGKCSRNHSGKIDTIYVKHVSGGWSTISLDTVVSYKQNPLGQESSNWDWIHVDEPIPEGQWKANVRGLVDRCGRAWFTCTPIAEPWIDAAFIPDLEDQTKANLGSVINTTDSRWMMTGTMDDNPHNSEEAKNLVLSWYTDDEREARRNGVPLAYSGLVYKEFSWADHVREAVPVGWADWQTPPPNYTIRIALDYHFRKNDAIMFIATSPEEISYVYAEIWEQMLIAEEVKRIKEILGGRDYQPARMDPLASTPNKVTDITAMDEYRRLGLAVLPATKDPVNGIRAVKATLKARDKLRRPVIYFNHECRRTLFEIARGYIWDGDNNKPIKNHDDMMENLYRLCLEGLTYIEPAASEDYHYIAPRDLPANVISPFEFSGLDDGPAEKKRSVSSNRYRR